MRWNLESEKPYTCEVIPSPNINMTFMPFGPRITGVITGKYTYDVTGKGMIAGITFKPGGFFPLYGSPVKSLTDCHVSATSQFPQATMELNSQILQCENNSDVLHHLEHFLSTQNATEDPNIEIINQIINDAITQENSTIEDIARLHNKSLRSIQHLFQNYIGVGLKWIILRSRLQKAAQYATQTKNPDWTEIALNLGYFDQSHFINDFKKIIGSTPGQYTAQIHSKK